MLAAEFFEKTYQDNDRPRITSREPPSRGTKALSETDTTTTGTATIVGSGNRNKHPRNSGRKPKYLQTGKTNFSESVQRLTSATPSPFRCGQPHVGSESSTNNNARPLVATAPKPTTVGNGETVLRDFAMIVSEAYRTECSSDHRPSSSSTKPVRTSSEDRKLRRAKQQQQPPRSSSKKPTASPPSDSRFLPRAAGSPRGVDELPRETTYQPKTKAEELLEHTPTLGIMDLYDEELRKNRDLQDTVSQLEVEISTLKISLTNAEHRNHHHALEDTPSRTDPKKDALPNSSSLLDEDAHGLSLSKSPYHKNPAADGSDSSSNNNSLLLSQTQRQLEESKQVIQMLFRDIKLVKQNESELRQKLKSSRSTLQKHQTRYEENMAIAMKSADDVRSNLRKLQQQRSKERAQASARVEHLEGELQTAREECLRWKAQWEAGQRALAEAKKPSPQRKTSVRRRQTAMENDHGTERLGAETRDMGEAMTKPEKTKDQPLDSKNSSSGSIRASKPHESSPPPPETRKEPETSFLSAAHMNFACGPSVSEPSGKPETHHHRKTLNEAPVVEHQPERPTRIIAAPDPGESNHKSSSNSQVTQRNAQITRHEQSNRLTQYGKLGLTSCVQGIDTTQDFEGAARYFPSKAMDQRVIAASHDDSKHAKKSTLHELMNQLKASRQRLKAADEKLNGLVQGTALSGIVGNPKESSSPVQHGPIESIDVVNSSNESIEVSRRSFAYV